LAWEKPPALQVVFYKDELKTDWQLAIDRKPLNKIEPLE